MAQYLHRAYDPASEDYVYWVADIPYDENGDFYLGPPAFGTLEGTVSLAALNEEAVGAFYEAAEETDQDLNVFYTPPITPSLEPLVVVTSVAEIDLGS